MYFITASNKHDKNRNKNICEKTGSAMRTMRTISIAIKRGVRRMAFKNIYFFVRGQTRVKKRKKKLVK